MTEAIPAIIVVEDEPDVLAVLRRVLHDLQLDHDIIAVENGSSALAQATHRLCALLITDYMLLGMDGLDLAREFKTRHGCPVIMITGYASSELSTAVQSSDIDRLIPKPFHVDALEANIRDVLAPVVS